MNTSESQFNELLANLIARVNQALSKSPRLPTLALALTTAGKIETSLGAEDNGTELHDNLNAMQRSLQDRVGAGDILAVCIAYPDYDAGAVIAYLENSETYCLKATLPVSTGSSLALDIANITTAEGTLFVFGVQDSEA
jgi:hypothetical protein